MTMQQWIAADNKEEDLIREYAAKIAAKVAEGKRGTSVIVVYAQLIAESEKRKSKTWKQYKRDQMVHPG